MAESRGFKRPINELWSSGGGGLGSTDADSEWLYEEEVSGPQDSESGGGVRVRRSRRDESRVARRREPTSRVEQQQYAVRGSYGEPGPNAFNAAAAASFKLTRGRSAAARYLQTTTTTTTTTHYHHGTRAARHGAARPPRHHPPRTCFSNETQEEVQEDDEASLRQLLVSLQKQVSIMSMNLSMKLDELQRRGDRQLETTVALCEIRSQLQELTKSVESCQSEVSEVKRDMVAIKHELDTVQQVKEEIEELREYVDRLEEHSHRRKLRLLEQHDKPSLVLAAHSTY